MPDQANSTETLARCIRCGVQGNGLILVDGQHICKKCTGAFKNLTTKFPGICLLCRMALAPGSRVGWAHGSVLCADCCVKVQHPESALRELINAVDQDGNKGAEEAKKAPADTVEFDGLASEPLTVTELTKQIADKVVPAFRNVVVIGEIGSFSEKNGTWYITLKDGRARLSAVCFYSDNRNVAFKPEIGLKVVASGAINVYAPLGKYSLNVKLLQPAGVGEFQLAFKQLKEKLEKEGLFAESNKRPLPSFPQRVALITSDTGAAIKDMLPILTRSGVSILVCSVKVQGKDADKSIVDALECLRDVPDIDVMIVGRGGGSPEDLQCFNSELLARAIRSSKVPIISAVGHEIDWSISDLAADRRAATPTAAAELIAGLRREMIERFETACVQITNSMDKHIRDVSLRLAKADVRQKLPQMDHRLVADTHKLMRTHEQLNGRMDLLIDTGVERKRESTRMMECQIGSIFHKAELRLAQVDTGKNTARLVEKAKYLEKQISLLKKSIVENAIENLGDKLRRQQESRYALIEGMDIALAGAFLRLANSKPYRLIDRYEERLKGARFRQHAARDQMITYVDNRLNKICDKCSALKEKLHALGPQSVTARGYAILEKQDGSLVTSAQSLEIGEEVIAKLRQGKVRLVVKAMEE